MELTQNDTENTEEQQVPVKKKRKNPFKEIHKEQEQRRKEKRARIVIRNISYKATEESLKEHFAQFGEIKEVNLLKRPDGKLVGCAFIQYNLVNQAAKAILKGNGKEFLSRPVYVDWAIGKDEYVKKFGANTKKEDKKEEIKEETLPTPDSSTPKEEPPIEEKSDSEDDKLKEHSGENESKENADEDTGSEYSDDEDIVEDDDSKENKKKGVETKIKKESGAKKGKLLSNDVVEGCTIFMKNVPFDATSDDLRKLCRKYGPVYYALITTDPISGHSKGTAFVKFKTKESADLCLKAGEELRLMDAILEPHIALSRDEIRNKIENKKKVEPRDSRNLYLAKEGLIMSGSKAAEGVSASDMAKRHKLEQMKTQILKNLNRFVSRNRLSIHNVPIHYDNEKLRKMVEQHTGLKTHECRIMRESKPTAEHPQGKSKGFGFVSFKTHDEALQALRKLNNNPTIFGSVSRPIVAFSIEDRSVHNIKEKRLQRSKEHNPTYKRKLEKLKAKRAKKQKDNKNQKDNKKQIEKKITKSKPTKKDKDQATELEDFVGMPAKPGSFVRMRSNKKIKEQAKEHLKKANTLKKIEKRKKERAIIRKEKRLIDRPKQGKKKGERDNFSLLVNKYKRLLDTASETVTKPTKRTKWYTE